MLRHWSPWRAARPVSMEGRIALGDARSLKSRAGGVPENARRCPKRKNSRRLGEAVPQRFEKIIVRNALWCFREFPVFTGFAKSSQANFLRLRNLRIRAQEDRKVVPD